MTFAHGRVECPDQASFRRHIHNDYEIFYFCEGDADYIVGSAVYRMNRRDLLIIRPGTYHYLRLRSNAPYERFIINFTQEDLAVQTEVLREDAMFHIASGSMIQRFFESWMESEAVFTKEEREGFVRSGLSMVLLLLQHGLQQQPILPEQENPALKEILLYIDRHPEEAITAERLSARFYVSTSWIVHIFRRYLGISLMQYIRRKRILYAQSLIWAGAAPTDVAEVCHFENYATFYRQYKAVLGHTPGADKLQIME